MVILGFGIRGFGCDFAKLGCCIADRERITASRYREATGNPSYRCRGLVCVVFYSYRTDLDTTIGPWDLTSLTASLCEGLAEGKERPVISRILCLSAVPPRFRQRACCQIRLFLTGRSLCSAVVALLPPP